MRYVNANAECYRSVVFNSEGQPSSYHQPFDKIIATQDEDGGYSIRDFVIKADISVHGTNNPEHESENPISRGDTLYFTVRLTRCERGSTLPLAFDVTSFSVDLAQLKADHNLSRACYDFYNQTHVINVTGIKLPREGQPIGKYVLKVLVRNDPDPKYDTIQAMIPLLIVAPSEVSGGELD